ncbi:MerR family transcriptional regulator [Roseateles oligotrophus]|uniref:MerR family transcriptional regulator n=1 Tax=Roseateles oligotrophus TaxID=1769250 RepID=A0ABT2Y8N8_9BURK|nr:MerR family transcriptional regulator [Roseateles oligotrophus]MCV2366653.1 MerR family transcriptional regulator [Roseateles oligotrophus]
MKIGDLAQRTGMAASAIRFYESSGLLPPAKRGANGYRQYDDETLQRLLVIQIAQRLGFSLETLRRLAGHQGREMPHDLVMQSLQERLAEIDAMQKTLASQRQETETLMQQLQAQWQQGRCLELGAGAPMAMQAG